MLDQIGESLHGFSVTNIRHSEELGGRLVEMVFEQTGTPLVFLDNGAENKLFAVAFHTLPEDSTGVFHILEHSVLCGSEKYPVREPFVELLKSSMNTFLNALTYPDKTVYPVSSRNSQDFLNLTAVYLDAVFAPRLLTDPNVFYQEGWHIEEAEDGTPSYKGVVFNEMKGAMGSEEELSSMKLMEMLFPDSPYGFNSGGDPAVIPSLRYEDFRETYRRFYHPSNARIILDGSVPLEETLRMISSYLSRFSSEENLPLLKEQKPVSPEEETISFELAQEESPENRECLSVGRIIGTWRDRVKLLAASVLNDALAGSNESPLKRAILSAGLAQECSISIVADIAQPYLEMHFQNVPDGRAAEILPFIRKTVSDLLEEGLDLQELEASANLLEFHLLEPEEPQGIFRCAELLRSWLYGGDPMLYLESRAPMDAVREMIRNGSFSELARELYLDESGTAVLHAVPSHTYGEEQRQAEKNRLAAVCGAWSEKDRAENDRLLSALTAWQQTPDTPEQLATLPYLELSAVSEEASFPETTETEYSGAAVLYHPVACKGIIHLNLYFSLTDQPITAFPLLTLAGALFTELATAQNSAAKLQQRLKNTFGRIAFSVTAKAKIGERKTCTPVLFVQCSLLENHLEEAFDLLCEVLFHTDFTQKEKIRELLIQQDERAKLLPLMSGHLTGMQSVLSHTSARGAVGDACSGLTAIRALHTLVKNYDEQFEAFSALLQKMQKDSFCLSRLTASVSAPAPVSLDRLLQKFPQGTPLPKAAPYAEDLPWKMGCRIPAQIGFAVQGSCISADTEQKATLRVAAKLISLSYLWNRVRVQGGAYGTGLMTGWDGTLLTYSFRDPTPLQSLEINRGISAFLREFCEGEESLDKYIISTLAEDDPLRSPVSEAAYADTLWFSGKTRADQTAERRAMLSVTREKLLHTCEIWDEFAERGAVCVTAADTLLQGRDDLTPVEL